MDRIYLSVFIAFFISGCIVRDDGSSRFSDRAWSLFRLGEFDRLAFYADSLHSHHQKGIDFSGVDSLVDVSRRVQFDFSRTADEVKQQLTDKGFFVNDSLLNDWTGAGLLEHRFYNGQTRYFKRAVSNFLLRQQRFVSTGKSGLIDSDFECFLDNAAISVMRSPKDTSMLCCPVTLELTFSICVNANAVPAGETIRCWLPAPRTDVVRQQQVQLVSSFPHPAALCSDTLQHQSVYLESVAVHDSVTRFAASYHFRSYAQFFNPDSMPIQSYDVQSPVYKRYIAEEPPHIVFSDEVKDLANRIPGNRENPLQAISNIFCWMNDHLMWIGAVEYGIQDSISTSVAQSLEGDCGMQTMLLMAVARCKGIPVRWQSGWMLHPGEVNLHDWCEVYYQGVGWVPLDVTFGMLRGDYSRAFYVTGMDSYRLAVNQGIGGVFSPPKRYRRSEPFDFQRGEVEWRGGNLYFDQWQYHLDVKMVD